ncbi:MAG TPA: ABC transporter permease [Candidatus Polarisedimenticolia bacterium]|nr:ABC transporter permease [Candidatus Polarisedimenticolia bacterium]
MRQLLLLMAKNCVRNPLRTVLTVAGIAVGVIGFGFLQTVLTAYYVGAEASSPNRLVTRHRVSLFNLLPLAQRDKIAQVSGVTGVSYGMWFGAYYQTPEKFFAQFACDPGYIELYPEFIIPPDQKAAWLNDLQGAVVGRKLAKRFGWKVGDRITLIGTFFAGNWDFIIDAIYDGRDRNTDETAMFFHWKLLDERINHRSIVGWYLVGISDPSATGRISKEIDDLFINSTAPTLTETEKDFNLSFVAMMGTIITIIKVAAWIVIGIILLIMANTMAMSARERTTEYGVLKTLGFGGRHLVTLIGGEAVLVSLLGAAVGCLLTFGMVAVVGRGIEENLGQIFPVFELTPVTMAQSVGLAVAAGLLASVIPIARAVRLSIADSLRRVG